MVRSITSLSRSGLLDWLVQRVSAVVLGSYALFMFGYLLFAGDIDYSQWHSLFSHLLFKLYTLAAMLSLVAHIWVGLWTVATDYLKNTWVRFIFLSVIAVVNCSYFLIGFSAVWGA
ncbi:MAG: succinate dehydrogenase, hydrophobic membrane anchor protein [Reinekea sp.]|jgi:succinate dehydrogenase / fumarate reductase, membrane anchor subunit